MANYTSVIASNICDAAGNKLASGTVSFQATDAANQPLNFQVGGGGQVVTTPATAAIVAGAIAGGFQVADSANTSPAGILYRITVTDTTLNRAVVTYSLVTVTGATFSLDNFSQTGAAVLPPTGGSVAGPLTVTGNLSVTGSYGTINAKNIEGIRYADQFANIQAAVTDAGTTGSVVIPSNYVGTDTYTNPNGIPILDFRVNNNAIGVWSVIQPSFPTASFPLGNDIALHSAGPADVRLRTRDLQVTASTSCTAGNPVTVAVAAPTLYGVAQSGNATALFSTNAALILDPGTSSEEVVGTFTIPSGASLSFTPAKSHTQPFKIRQQGIVFLDAAYGIEPTSDPTGQYQFFRIFDGNGNVWMQLPIQNGAFPLSSPQQVAIVTGGNGANNNIAFRNNNAASQLLLLKSDNSVNLISVDDNGNDIRNGTGGGVFVKNSGTQVCAIQNSAGTGIVTSDIFRTNSASNPAQIGNVRLGSTQTVNFRNNANSADLNGLSKNISDQVIVGGSAGVILGAGTALTRYARYSLALSPVAVAANTTAEQSFATSVTSGDVVIGISKPTAQAGLGIVGWRASGTTLFITFSNNTASPITPTASETYQIVAVQ